MTATLATHRSVGRAELKDAWRTERDSARTARQQDQSSEQQLFSPSSPTLGGALAFNTPPGYGMHMAGYEMSKDELLKSLGRIEGQVRGLAQMVEDDRYCIDVLTQVSAVTKSLQRVAVGMFDDHLRHCVADAVEKGGPEADQKLTEATAAVTRLLRT